MSNTGHKGVSYLPGQGVYKVTVGWKGKVVVHYVRGDHPKDLKRAIRVRNQTETRLGKPRSEAMLRSSGFAQGTTWKRRGKKIVKSRKRRR